MLFEIRFQGNPNKIRPQRALRVAFHMPASVWHKLFPESEKLDQPEENVTNYRYHSIRTLYKEEFRNVEDLQEFFGPDWFITHFEQSVGVNIGKVKFCLKEKTITQMQTLIEEHCNTKIDDESVQRMSRTYCCISFMFTRITRRQLGVRGRETNWRSRVNELLKQKNVRKQVIKRIN